MAPIVESIEIARTPEDVYAYIDQPERHGEWSATGCWSSTTPGRPTDDGDGNRGCTAHDRSRPRLASRRRFRRAPQLCTA
jgi:hypothetical protein